MTFCAGILLQEFAGVEALYILGISTGLTIGIFAAGRNDRFLFVFLIVTIALFGYFRNREFTDSPNPVLAALTNQSTTVLFTGIVQQVDSSRSGRLYAVTRPVRIYRHTLTARPVQVWLPPIRHVLSAGDTLRCAGQFAKYPPARNPGQFDYRNYQRLRHRYFQVQVRFPWEVEIRPGRLSVVRSFVEQSRHRILNFLHQQLSQPSAAFASALLLGQKDLVPETLLNTYSSLGIIHVMAVSGLHVGFITLILIVLAGLFRFPRPIQTAFVILGLLFYAALVDFRPSVVRASVMAGLFLLAITVQQRYDILNILGLAALIILWQNPRQIHQLGFQLSFLAVLGIILITGRMTALSEGWGFHLRDTSPPIRWALGSIVVSVGAFLATAPIVAFHFGIVPVWGILLNLLVVPAVGFIIICLLTMVLLGLIWTPAGALYSALPDFTITTMNTILQKVQAAGFHAIRIRHIHWSTVLIAYLVLLGFLLWDYRFFKRLYIYGGLIGMNVWILLWHPSPRSLRVTFLDVGQGDAALVELPNHQSMLIDTGDRNLSGSEAEEVILPYFQFHGVRRLNILVISHTDRDHTGGVPALLREGQVQEIWYPAIADTTRVLQAFKKMAHYRGTTMHPIRAGFDTTLGTVQVQTFYPGKLVVDATPNNHSLVQRITYGRNSMLFPGDIEKKGEQVLAVYDGMLHSDIIKVPHHGSITSSSEQMLQEVQPTYAIVSVGRGNRFGLPDPPVLKRYRNHGTQVLQTAIEGAIIFESDGRGWHRIHWRSDE